MKHWRKLPPTLVAMFVIALATAVVTVAFQLTHSLEEYSVRYDLAELGIWLVIDVLAIAGFIELARRATGRESLGFRIAAFGTLFAVLTGILWQWIFIVRLHDGIDTLERVQQWSSFVARLLPLFGVIVAASVSRRREAIVGAIVLIVTDPLPSIARHIFGWFGGFHAQMIAMHVLGLAAIVTLVWLAAAVARPADGPTPAPSAAPTIEATAGLRTIASGLWLRVIAACTVAGLTLMIALGTGGADALPIIRLASMSGAVVAAISLAIIARGSLRALGGELPTWPLLAGAIATVWALGVALAQLPEMYEMLYGADQFGASAARETTEALSIIAPLVAIAGIAAFARAIAGFAARRGLEQLRFEAQGKALGFVTLMLASVGLQQWLLPKAESQDTFVLMLVAATAASLWATVLMARLCTTAADTLSTEPGLPTATLRS